MKNINKLLIGLVTVGITFIVIGFTLGGHRQIREMHQNGVSNFGWYNVDHYELNEEYSDIENLNINLNTQDVVIEEYQGDTIRVEGFVNENITINVNNNTLELRERGRTTWFNIGFGFSYSSDLVIYIPEGTQFDNVYVNISVGTFTNTGTLKADQVQLNINTGEIKADTIICNTGEFDIDVGSINIDLLDSQESDLEINIGDILVTVIGEEKDYSFDVKSNIGDITIGSRSLGGMSRETSGGSGTRFINANCDVGSIRIRMKGG